MEYTSRVPDRSVETSAGECPLCGGDNRCGLVAGESRCWCFDTRIAAAVLDKVPPEARDRACICRTCATSGVASTAAHGGAAER